MEEGEEVEARDPGVLQEDLILLKTRKTFLLVQKSLNATYKDMVRRWPDRFTREPPFSFTVLRIFKRARVLKRARENIILAGRNDFKAFIL